MFVELEVFNMRIIRELSGFRILLYLNLNPLKSFLAKDIVKNVGITQTTASKAIRELVTEGLIEKTKKDNRSYQYKMTEKGIKLLEYVTKLKEIQNIQF